MLFKNKEGKILITTREYHIITGVNTETILYIMDVNSPLYITDPHHIWKLALPNDINKVVSVLRDIMFNYRLCYDGPGIIGSDLYTLERIQVGLYKIHNRPKSISTRPSDTSSNILRSMVKKILREITR